jgi:hypothetical protein
MMDLKFDIKGHLTPYERSVLSVRDFEEIFVNSFDEESTRYQIFKNYKRFIEVFKKEITPNFTQWINGSFVTNKQNPKDIDFVTIISSDIYNQKRDLIDKKFRLTGAKKMFDVDAYTIEVYPESHKNFGISKIDLVYWDNWFSKTKRNKHNKTFPKGYIEIEY